MFIRFVSDPHNPLAADECTVECQKYSVRRHENGEVEFNMDSGAEIMTLAAPKVGPWRQAYVMNNDMKTVERYRCPAADPDAPRHQSVLHEASKDGAVSLG